MPVCARGWPEADGLPDMDPVQAIPPVSLELGERSSGAIIAGCILGLLLL
jgi:hypothetical protein